MTPPRSAVAALSQHLLQGPRRGNYREMGKHDNHSIITDLESQETTSCMCALRGRL